MLGLDLALLCSEAQRFWADADQGGGLRQVHPAVGLARLGMTDGDFVVAAKRCHPFAGPPIAMSSAKIVTVEHARDYVIAACVGEQAHRLHNFRCGAVASSSPPAARHAYLGMNTAHPVHNKNNLSRSEEHTSELQSQSK